MPRIVLDREWAHKPVIRAPERLTEDVNHAYVLLRQSQSEYNDLDDKFRRLRSDNDDQRSKLLAAEEALQTWKNISKAILVAVCGVIVKELFPLIVKAVLR